MLFHVHVVSLNFYAESSRCLLNILKVDSMSLTNCLLFAILRVPVESLEPTQISAVVAVFSWRRVPTITYDVIDTSDAVFAGGDCDDDDHEKASKDTRTTFQCSALFKTHGQ